MNNLYTYERSRAAFERAERVIPAGVYGHLGPAEGCFIPVDAFPFFSSKAQGAYFWDVDGNRFIDYMCAYGPNILGYNDPDVDAAAAQQRKLGDCITSPGTAMIDFAELLVDTVQSADWAMFAKNGNDATSAAIMTARHHTKRKKVIFFKGYYHGVTPWSRNADYPGVIPEDVAHNIYLPWNDLDAVADTFKKHEGQIAAVISQPYMHGNFADNTLPAEGFWQGVRKLCDDNQSVLILDDVRAGFRLDLGGSDKYFGFSADLICFCKALANGYNVSALCGKNFLKNAVAGLGITGSYWLSAVPLAAGVACLNKMKQINLPELLRSKGERLVDGLAQAATANGFDLRVSGPPALFYLRLADDPTLMLHQRFIAQCVKRGVFLTNHHNHFLNAALSDEDIDFTVAVADQAFKAIK